MSETYDIVVLGAGPTGENVADRAVRGGLTAAIVESELVGGECSYWACMPSKALLRPVSAVSEASQLQGVTGARLVPDEVLKRRDSFASGWKDDSQVQWLDSAKIALYRGQGRLAGERKVTVTRDGAGSPDGEVTELAARHAVVIATGTRAVIPPPLRDVRPWTSREATSAHAVPRRLAIVGGGVVGCEMACAWQALGSQVTLIVRGTLLDKLPDFAGELVANGLRDSGADVRLSTSVTKAVRAAAEGPVTLTLSDGTEIEADEVLAATGRAPRTDDIGLETVGLEPGSWLEVDDTLRVRDTGSLYAAGDVNHLALLTHMGKYQARVCGDAVAARAHGREPAIRDRSSQTSVPQVIFTAPEVAAVGLTERQARDQGVRTRVVDYDLAGVAGAALFADGSITSGGQPLRGQTTVLSRGTPPDPQDPPTYSGYEGHAQMVVDEDKRTIVGLTLAGPGTGEMIHAATIAIAGEVPLDTLWHAVPAYPTMSELWLRLLETYGL